MLPTWAEHSDEKISWDGAQEGVTEERDRQKDKHTKRGKLTKDLT